METFKREVVLDSVRYYPLRPARQDRARLEHRVLQSSSRGPRGRRSHPLRPLPGRLRAPDH
jgi:hypothetical protein